MRTRSKLLLAGMTAALAMAAFVNTASANRLSTTDQDFSASWSALSFIAAGATISCPVSLEGSFSTATIGKTAEAIIGSVHDADIDGACTGGTATIDQSSLPWDIAYGGFAGTLPNITSITLQLVGALFTVDPAGGLPACQAGTTEEEPGVGIANRDGDGDISLLDADQTRSIDLRGGFLCELGGDSQFNGNASVTTGRITLV